MNIVQIDVEGIDTTLGLVVCNLYTPNRHVTVVMHPYDYESLVEDGFFESADSERLKNMRLTYYENLKTTNK